MYVAEPDVVGVTVWEPVAAWLPLQAPLAEQEAASVLDHVRVADWPAVIDVGLTDTVTVGIGAGGAVDPLPPHACSARPVRAAAAAGQCSRSRRLVRVGDMFPGPRGVLRRRRPNTTQRGGVPQAWNRVRNPGAEVEFTPSQTRAAPVLFRGSTATRRGRSFGSGPVPSDTSRRVGNLQQPKAAARSLIQREMTADVWKSQKIPIGSMNHRAIGFGEGCDLRIRHEVARGPASSLE